MQKDLYNEKAIERLSNLSEKDKEKTIIFIGKVGTGKTHLAKYFFPNSYFISEAEFKQKIVSGAARLRTPDEYGSDIYTYPLEALSKLDVVIYDDYGSADLSPAYIEKTLYWIDARQNKKKPMIITTNLTYKQLEEREARIASRLLHNSIIILLDGPDRRKSNIEIIK